MDCYLSKHWRIGTCVTNNIPELEDMLISVFQRNNRLCFLIQVKSHSDRHWLIQKKTNKLKITHINRAGIMSKSVRQQKTPNFSVVENISKQKRQTVRVALMTI